MLHKHKLTAYEILDLAWEAALLKWGNEKEHLDNLPDNPVAQRRERDAYERLQAIGEMLKEIE